MLTPRTPHRGPRIGPRTHIHRDHGAWYVHITRAGRSTYGHFADATYGSRGLALVAAQRHRDELLRRHFPPDTRIPRGPRKNKRHATGIVGVSRQSTRPRIWREVREGKESRSSEMAFVYILRCCDGSLYAGVTKDLATRVRQHSAGRASRYTRSRLPVELVWQCRRPTWGDALREERRIKKLRRTRKLALIAAARPTSRARRPSRRTARAGPYCGRPK